MPPYKRIPTEPKKQERHEEKLVKPDVVTTKHIRIRDGLWEHLSQGKMSQNDFCVFCTLLKWAWWGTGICVTSAASIAANWGDQMKVNTVQVCLGRLRDAGYIKYPEGTGKRGVYPVLINKYEPQVGVCAGWRLNADASDDYENPVYEYVSDTPYRSAYGDAAMDNATRVWSVSGDPYRGAEGKYVIRRPLKSLMGDSAVTSTVNQRSVSGGSAVSQRSISGEPCGESAAGQPFQTLHNRKAGTNGTSRASRASGASRESLSPLPFSYVVNGDANSTKNLKEPEEQRQHPPIEFLDEVPVKVKECTFPLTEGTLPDSMDEKAVEFAANWKKLMVWNPDPIPKGENEWAGVFRELLNLHDTDVEDMVAYSQSQAQQIYNRQPQSLLKNHDRVHTHMVNARNNKNKRFYGDWNVILSDYMNMINGLAPSWSKVVGKVVDEESDEDEEPRVDASKYKCPNCHLVFCNCKTAYNPPASTFRMDMDDDDELA